MTTTGAAGGRVTVAGMFKDYAVIGLIAIAAIILAKMVFPKVPVLNGLAGYL